MRLPLAFFLAPILAVVLAASLLAGASSAGPAARRVRAPAPPPAPAKAALPLPPWPPTEPVARLGPDAVVVANALHALDVPLAGVPADVNGARVPDSVRALVRVDRFGVVRRVGFTRGTGSAALDSSAAAAARWAIFPKPAAEPSAWWPVSVRFDRSAAEPLDGEDDVVTAARAAERAGDAQNALYLWLGALGRAGTHPEFANPWSLRERAILAARRISPTPVVPLKYLQEFGRLEGLSERAISTEANTDVLERITRVLEAAPWHGPAWRIRAAAESALGQPVAAMRSLSCWQLSTPDSVTTARVASARAQITSGELLMASRALQQP